MAEGVSEAQDPAKWFDQFTGMDHHPGMDSHSEWCWRHWAPCPVYGANGLGCSIEVTQVWMARHVPPGASAAEANRLRDEGGRFCCALGDRTMYEIWGRWGPPAASSEGVN